MAVLALIGACWLAWQVLGFVTGFLGGEVRTPWLCTWCDGLQPRWLRYLWRLALCTALAAFLAAWYNLARMVDLPWWAS